MTTAAVVKILYVWRKVLRKSMERNRRSVSRSNRRSTLAYRICGTLQELSVLLKHMSTSSLCSRASDLQEKKCHVK